MNPARHDAPVTRLIGHSRVKGADSCPHGASAGPRCPWTLRFRTRYDSGQTLCLRVDPEPFHASEDSFNSLYVRERRHGIEHLLRHQPRRQDIRQRPPYEESRCSTPRRPSILRQRSALQRLHPLHPHPPLRDPRLGSGHQFSRFVARFTSRTRSIFPRRSVEVLVPDVETRRVARPAADDVAHRLPIRTEH